MTARQEAYQLISKLPDDTVIYLVELLKRMPPEAAASSDIGAPVRLGLGKGVITDPADFDLWDAELAAMFEDESL
jgi:hypothetical protein